MFPIGLSIPNPVLTADSSSQSSYHPRLSTPGKTVMSKALLKSTGVVSAMTSLSRVTGFIRD
ncbi:MAG: hypothetical protein KDJ22_10215, partial [Candidatus Competibacteraceae bacterium]|nr:hypothetical protein [Candidatus Competibacteraceae bacterium]